MEIAGKVLEWRKVPCSTIIRLGVNSTVLPKHYSCYDTDRTAEIIDAPTSVRKGERQVQKYSWIVG